MQINTAERAEQSRAAPTQSHSLPKRLLCAIAVVHVPIDDGDALHAMSLVLQSVVRRQRYVIEQTKPHTQIALGVMSPAPPPPIKAAHMCLFVSDQPTKQLIGRDVTAHTYGGRHRT